MRCWMRAAAALAAIGLIALLPGCEGRDRRARTQQGLERYVLAAAPAGIASLDIDYQGQVTLLGYTIEPAGPVKPGAAVTVTLYWRCEQKLEAGWKLFTHLDDGAGHMVKNLDSVGPLREKWHGAQRLGPDAWEPGKVYADEQSFTLPAKVTSEQVVLYTGVWKGRKRLRITRGPRDTHDRGKVVAIPTGVKPPPVPSLEVTRLAAGQRVTVDGKLDEPAWKGAAATGPFVNASTGQPNTRFPVNGKALLAWDDLALYVAFSVQDPDITGGFDPKSTDPHLWTRDCVELMIDPDGDGDNRDYYEIQISPQNLVFDSRFDDYNKPRGGPEGPFGHQEWSAGLQSAVALQGTLDQPGDKDTGYTVELRIPWKSFDRARQVPPRPGDVWRINLYAMQNDGGVAWSPILGKGNFHRASRFGRVTWAAGESEGSAK